MDDTTTPDGTGPVTVTVTDGVAVIDLDDGKANAMGFDVPRRARERPRSRRGRRRLRRRHRRPGGEVLRRLRPEGDDLRVPRAHARHARTRSPARPADVHVPKPVVLAVTGHALAMGAILLCCADVPRRRRRPVQDRPQRGGDRHAGARLRGRHLPGPTGDPAFTAAIQLARIHSPAEALAAGFLDEVVDVAAVRDRAVEVAAELGTRLHRGPFRVTRDRAGSGGRAAPLRELAADLSVFDVSS